MQVSMHNWMRAEPVETTIRRLAKYGYNSIEISYDSVELSPGAPGTKAVKQMLADNGIGCYGSISLMFTGRDLIHADPAVRASSVEYLKQCTQMVADLDGSTMSIVPSEVGKVKAMASPEEEWAWAVEGLKEVRDFANRVGVRVAIEPLNRFETNFINRHDQALALAEAVGPDVGVCLDVYHMNMEDASMFKAIENCWQQAVRPAPGRQQPHGLRHGRARVGAADRHVQEDRLRGLADRRVCAADRPHAGQPV